MAEATGYGQRLAESEPHGKIEAGGLHGAPLVDRRD